MRSGAKWPLYLAGAWQCRNTSAPPSVAPLALPPHVCRPGLASGLAPVLMRAAAGCWPACCTYAQAARSGVLDIRRVDPRSIRPRPGAPLRRTSRRAPGARDELTRSPMSARADFAMGRLPEGWPLQGFGVSADLSLRIDPRGRLHKPHVREPGRAVGCRNTESQRPNIGARCCSRRSDRVIL
jgi:hypothetical protein